METDYVLGTNADEIARLGLQHRVWRAAVLECWQRAGITEGSRVVDVGAGPGYATIDLAEIVGANGKVLAIERSERFLDYAREACALRKLTQVEFRHADLMTEDLGKLNFDAAWCRWVASFVSSPELLVQKMASALCPGGVAIFHEYLDYKTWRLAPRRPAMESFVEEVMASWRANGGEPDVALQFPPLLKAAGLRVVYMQPHVLTISPKDYAWRWPASFIETNLARLQQLGRVQNDWIERVREEFRVAEAEPTTLLTTPMFLEVIARRE